MTALRVFEIARPCGCGSTRMTIGQAWSIRLQRLYPWVCVDCGTVQTQYAKKVVALAEQDRCGGLPEVKTVTQSNPERFEAEVARNLAMVCAVCGSRDDVQCHHWAPFHLFGGEYDRWPTSDLCQKCHTRWHQIVTPNMGKH